MIRPSTILSYVQPDVRAIVRVHVGMNDMPMTKFQHACFLKKNFNTVRGYQRPITNRGKEGRTE